MSHSPRVSVCIPTVNRPALLREAIASVAAQTWCDFEIIVGDNSGTPEGHRRIDEVLTGFSDLPIVLKRHPTQIDAYENFNSLVECARGELWACLPDDDRYRPDFLSRSIQALDAHPDAAFTFADHWIMNGDGIVDEGESLANSARYGRDKLSEGVYVNTELFEIALNQSLCLQATVFRHSVVASQRFLSGILVGDHSFFLRLAASDQKIKAYYVNQRLIEYRLHHAQITSTTARRDMIRALIASFESVPVVPTHHAGNLNRHLARNYLSLALLDAEEGLWSEARAHGIRSLTLDATLRNALGALLVSTAPFAVKHVREYRRFLRRGGSSSP